MSAGRGNNIETGVASGVIPGEPYSVDFIETLCIVSLHILCAIVPKILVIQIKATPHIISWTKISRPLPHLFPMKFQTLEIKTPRKEHNKHKKRTITIMNSAPKFIQAKIIVAVRTRCIVKGIHQLLRYAVKKYLNFENIFLHERWKPGAARVSTDLIKIVCCSSRLICQNASALVVLAALSGYMRIVSVCMFM